MQSLPAPNRLWQHVTSAIKDRDQLRATQEKFVLEEAQRREARERGEKPWTPRLFHQDPVTSEWTYRHIEYEHTLTPSLRKSTGEGTCCLIYSLHFNHVCKGLSCRWKDRRCGDLHSTAS